MGVFVFSFFSFTFFFPEMNCYNFNRDAYFGKCKVGSHTDAKSANILIYY